MRLIDADAFCGFLREVSTRHHYETLLTKKDRYPTVADVIEEICCELDGTGLNGFDNAPTIEERKKGKWIITGRTNVYNGFEVLCSNCGTTLMVSKRRYEIGENYCDVCGAKMAKEG